MIISKHKSITLVGAIVYIRYVIVLYCATVVCFTTHCYDSHLRIQPILRGTSCSGKTNWEKFQVCAFSAFALLHICLFLTPWEINMSTGKSTTKQRNNQHRPSKKSEEENNMGCNMHRNFYKILYNTLLFILLFWIGGQFNSISWNDVNIT